MESKKVEWVCLTRAQDDIEFQMVAGLLQMANIPVVRKVQDIDNFVQILIGKPLAGIEIHVPEDRFEEAFQLINSSVEEEDMEEEDKEAGK